MHTFKKLPIMLPNTKRDKRMNHSGIVCCLSIGTRFRTYFLLIQKPVIKVAKITPAQMPNLNTLENSSPERRRS